MRATLLSASIAALVASVAAQAQSDVIPLLVPPEPTISSPPDPAISSPPNPSISTPSDATLSTPGTPTLSFPANPSLSSPPNPGLSSPPDATISVPGTPTISSPPANLSTPVQPTLSTPPLPSIRDSFPLPPFLTDPLGSMRSSLSTPVGSSFSSFGGQSSFLGRQGMGLTSSSSSSVSSSLLDTLSDPIELLDVNPVSSAPSPGVGSSATLGGARPFPELCQPEDFTCE